MRVALTSVTGTLDAARRALAAIDPAAVGAPPLVNQATQFAASWQYGITQLGQHAHYCTVDLSKIAATFEQADRQLAAAANNAGQHGTGR
jgi:hypothetical protein